MQVSKGVLQRIMKGNPLVDHRLKNAPRILPLSMKRRKCLEFFATLYCSLGETLPNKFHGRYCRRRKLRCEGMDANSDMDEDDYLWHEAATTYAKKDIMAELSNATKYLQSGFGQDPTSLPLRFLPPGNVMTLFCHYRACIPGAQEKGHGNHISYSTLEQALVMFQDLLEVPNKG